MTFSIFAHEKEADNRNWNGPIITWSKYCDFVQMPSFNGENIYNHQLDLEKVTNIMPWQVWNSWENDEG